MKNRRTKSKILFLSIFLLFLIIFLNVVINDRLKIKFAEITDFKDTLNLSGFIVRDEEIIYSPVPLDNRYISFSNLENEKVSQNSNLANIYDSHNSSVVPHKVKDIENEIQIIKKIDLVPVLQNETMSMINKKISNLTEKLSVCKSKSEFLEIKNLNKEILYLLSVRSKILGKNISELSKKTHELENKKNNLNLSESKNFLSIEANSSGNIVRYIDGFENIFDYKNLLNLEKLDFENISPISYGSDVIGKMIKSQTSYILFNLPEDKAKRLKEYSELYLSIDNIDCFQNIPCKIESLKKHYDSLDYMLIVSFDVINENINSLRKENFKISTRNYTGIKIDKSAVHLKDTDNEKFGVYVKYGKHTKFKDINIIFANNDFVICSYGPDYYNNENYLQPGDKVIIQGKNLKK